MRQGALKKLWVALAMAGACSSAPLAAQEQGGGTEPQPASFSGLASAPEVTLSIGAATTGIPILVPAGHKNLTPNIGVRYISGSGAGPYGVGWTLPLARIERDSRFGALGCPDPGEAQYRFVLSTPLGSTPCKLEPQTNQCIPQVEGSFLRIHYLPDSNAWEVKEKSGITHRFGEVLSARVFNGAGNELFRVQNIQQEVGFDVRCTWTAAWGVTSTQDLNGNRVTYLYESEPGLLPLAVEWGGNVRAPTAPVYRVRFVWEERPRDEAVSSVIGGIPVLYNRRLEKIHVETLSPYGLVRTYAFLYEDEVSPGISTRGRPWLLRAVQLRGRPESGTGEGPLLTRSDGMPASSVFHYAAHRLPAVGESGTLGFGAAMFLGSAGEGSWSKQERTRETTTTDDIWRTTADALDMNGDGRPDAVGVVQGASGNCQWRVRYSLAGSEASWQVPQNFCAIRVERHKRQAQEVVVEKVTLDMNGDGVPDYVDATVQPWHVYLGIPPRDGQNGGFLAEPVPWEGTAWEVMPELTERLKFERRSTGGSHETTDFTVMDMNGDGVPDWVSADGRAWTVLLGKTGCTVDRVISGDRSGCGFNVTYYSVNGMWVPVPNFDAPQITSVVRHRKVPAIGTSGVQDRTGVVFQDVRDINGDRLPDLLVYEDWDCNATNPNCAPRILVYPNRGNGFATLPEERPVRNILCGRPDTNHYTLGGLQAVAAGRSKPDKIGRDLVDINGDGLPDLVSACELYTSYQPFYSGNVAYPHD